jgi:hypothetical protein
MYQSDILEVLFRPVVLAQLCSDKFSILYTGIRMAEEVGCGCTCTLMLLSNIVSYWAGTGNNFAGMMIHFTARLAAVVSCYYLLSQHAILEIHWPTSYHRHFVATI